jgi:hypothetical protein
VSLPVLPESQIAMLAEIRAEHARLLAVLARVPPGRMEEPGVIGDWSIKDVLAHLAMWYARAVTVIFQAERGEPKPVKPAAAPNPWGTLNAADIEAQKERPLDRIRVDFDGAHAQLLKRLDAWKDDGALFDRALHKSMQGQSLASYCFGNSAEHDAEHRLEIEAWLARSGAA